MPDFQKLIARLQTHYGAPELPPASGAFELVLWENACYLLPDHRRAAVFEGLRTQVGLTAQAILAAPHEVLLELATMGGMHPETRVSRWQEIARIVETEFDGNLEQILPERSRDLNVVQRDRPGGLSYSRAKRALKLFPSIGDPGVEKILLFCGVAVGLPLESNGLRVLGRIGYGRIQMKNYGAMYKSVQEAVASELPQNAEDLARAHLLLRTHGKTLCKDGQPLCDECPIESECMFRHPGSKG